MKLVDAIKEKGRPFNVPDCSRNELPEFFKEMGFKVGAEIGVFKGEFTEKFCKAGLSMYAIDDWRRNRIYKKAKRLLEPYKNCTIIKKTSMEAINDFPAGSSLDFVYIDGDHRFPSIAQDLYYWCRRVKRGGIIAGHDYLDTRPEGKMRGCEVKSVVDAFINASSTENFYIFGRSKPIDEEEYYDKVLSFMFFKHW